MPTPTQNESIFDPEMSAMLNELHRAVTPPVEVVPDQKPQHVTQEVKPRTPEPKKDAVDLETLLKELHDAVQPLGTKEEVHQQTQEREAGEERDRKRNNGLLKKFIEAGMENLIHRGLTYPVTPYFEGLLDTFITQAGVFSEDIANVSAVESRLGLNAVPENILHAYIKERLELLYREDAPYKEIKKKYTVLLEDVRAYLLGIWGEDGRGQALLAEVRNQADKFLLPDTKVKAIITDLENAPTFPELMHILEQNDLLQREDDTHKIDRERKRPAALSKLLVSILRNTHRVAAVVLSRIVNDERKNTEFDPKNLLPDIVGNKTGERISKNGRMIIRVTHGDLDGVSLQDLQELKTFCAELPQVTEPVVSSGELSNAAVHIFFNELEKCKNLSNLYSLTMMYVSPDIQAPADKFLRLVASKLFNEEDFQRVLEAARKKEEELLVPEKVEKVKIPDEYSQKLYEQTISVLEHGEFIENGIPLVRKLMSYLTPMYWGKHENDEWYLQVTDEIGDVIMERVAALDANTTTQNHLEETGRTREGILSKLRWHLVHFGVVLDHIFNASQLETLGFDQEQIATFLPPPPARVDNQPGEELNEPPKTEQTEVEYEEPKPIVRADGRVVGRVQLPKESTTKTQEPNN